MRVLILPYNLLFRIFPQTINGDVSAAVAHHEMLFMVHKEHGLLPEAFTTDMDIYWPYHLIRPELVESTYLLYKSTKDPYYLYVGAELLESIEQHARVPCGFAAIEVSSIYLFLKGNWWFLSKSWKENSLQWSTFRWLWEINPYWLAVILNGMMLDRQLKQKYASLIK